MATQASIEIVKLGSMTGCNTAIYDEYFRIHGLPSPSHGIEIPFDVKLPEEVQGFREAVIEACTELQALIRGPLAHLYS